MTGDRKGPNKTNATVFQDRCLQPLGHPSTRVFSPTNEELPADCNRRWTITVRVECPGPLSASRAVIGLNADLPDRAKEIINCYDSRDEARALGRLLLPLALDRNRDVQRRIIRLILREDP
jgi:hypothetical protein